MSVFAEYVRGLHLRVAGSSPALFNMWQHFVDIIPTLAVVLYMICLVYSMWFWTRESEP